MPGNYLNNLFSGILSAGGAITSSIIQKGNNSRHEELMGEYAQIRKNLISQGTDYSSQQNDMLKLVPPPEGSRQPIQQIPIDPKQVYSNLIDKSLQLGAEYGDKSKPYVSALENIYKNQFAPPEDPSKNDITIGNKRLRPDRFGNYQEVYGEDKPPKEKSFMNMSQEEILSKTDAELKNLNTAEVYSAFGKIDYLPQVTQDKLKELYPGIWDKIQQEEAEKKKTGVSRKRYGKGTPKTDEEANNLLAVANNNQNYNSLEPEEQKAFEQTKQQLADQMGMTIDELNQTAENYRLTGDKEAATDETTTANIQQYQQDLVSFQDDIENNVYGYVDDQGNKQGNYNISPDDWFRELHEAGFLDNITDTHYNIINDWFKAKTGVSIRKYLK